VQVDQEARESSSARRRGPTLILALVVGIAAVGVAFKAFGGGSDSSAPDGIFFPTFAESTDAYSAALDHGTITLDDGCILLQETPDHRVLLLWPHGSTIETTGDGMLRVRFGETPIAWVGEEADVGGGLVGEAASETSFPEEIIGTSIPPRCHANDGYWYTEPNIRPAAPPSPPS